METIVVPAIRADMEFILYFYRNWLWCLVFQVFAPLFIINAISFAGSILQIEPFISPLLIQLGTIEPFIFTHRHYPTPINTRLC